MNKKFEVDNLSASNFTSFGFCMSGRKFSTPSYRYSFQGMEKNSEWNEGSYDFGARMYDGRSGRWLAIDQLAKEYPDLSPYSFAANNPINLIDPDGRKIMPTKAFKNAFKAHWGNIEGNSYIIKYSKARDIVFDYKDLNNPRRHAQTVNSKLVEINSTFFNSGSDETVILKTVVHELIHAKLDAQVDAMFTTDSDGKSVLRENAATMYPGIMAYYKKYGNNDKKPTATNNSTRDWQHNWMADYGRQDILAAMKEHDIKECKDRTANDYTSDDWYEAMSFGGLEGTDAWNKLGQDKKDLYTKIIDAESSKVRLTMPELNIVINKKQLSTDTTGTKTDTTTTN